MKRARDDVIVMDDTNLHVHGEETEEKEEEEHGHLVPCDVLLSLACGSSSSDSKEGTAPPRNKRHRRRRQGAAFECRTCGRRFTTFQALGGHRTSHLRRPATKKARPKPAVHVCATCGLGFSTGQALGGHMRRHQRAGMEESSDDMELKRIYSQERPSSASLQLLQLFV